MIENTINTDIKNAMMEKNAMRLEALRTIKTAIQLEKAKEGTELTDEQVIKIIQKLVSQRTESAVQYASADRVDLVEHELDLVTVFKLYLPEQMSEAEINAKVKEIITNVGATSVRDMGKVMSIVNKDLAGKVDAKAVGQLVKQLLTLKT
jgi:uncharacterized protein YqeY